MTSYGKFGGTSIGGGQAGVGGGRGANYGAANSTYDAEGQRPPSGEKSILRSGDMAEKEHQVNVYELIGVPWGLLVLILACYLVAGAYGQLFVLWMMPVVLCLLFGFFVRYHYKLGNNDEVVLGVLSLAAIVIATSVGVYANLSMLQEYHRLSQGASYFNVLPSEAVDGKLDATTMAFTQLTVADTSRSYGFVDATDPNAPIYCVAPISTGEASFTRIQFWAAGINCCDSLKNFVCGDAAKSGAHGAFILPQSEQVSDGFAKAITGAEAAYGLKTGNGFLLFQWSMDPIQYRDSQWNSSVMLFVIFAAVYLGISGMAGFVIMPMLKGQKDA
eukprot:CAMPEP_0115081658 /NCGR_PEP_ID=MMETSP0227-20121206/19416_1 /TAXON_ID=89957 /ORGANISM="Polarella glacialis, Strain CCMP 1383" /LENGTH=330 /DNA_ID=CAMNT_0002469557 /DNA_START=237 /DNA_END=1229 /DNA_ORIENTATION=-